MSSKTKPCKINPEEMYSIRSSEVDCGLSRAERLKGKAAGVIRVLPSGRQRFIKGADIIRWIELEKEPA
jgi:hypothetical protein